MEKRWKPEAHRHLIETDGPGGATCVAEWQPSFSKQATTSGVRAAPAMDGLASSCGPGVTSILSSPLADFPDGARRLAASFATQRLGGAQPRIPDGVMVLGIGLPATTRDHDYAGKAYYGAAAAPDCNAGEADTAAHSRRLRPLDEPSTGPLVRHLAFHWCRTVQTCNLRRRRSGSITDRAGRPLAVSVEICIRQGSHALDGPSRVSRLDIPLQWPSVAAADGG